MGKGIFDEEMEKLVIKQFKEDRFWYKTKDVKISYVDIKKEKIKNGYQSRMTMTIEVVDRDSEKERTSDHEERFEKLYEYLVDNGLLKWEK